MFDSVKFLKLGIALFSLALFKSCTPSSGGSSIQVISLEFQYAGKTTTQSWDSLSFTAECSETLSDYLTKRTGGITLRLGVSGAQVAGYLSSVEFNATHKLALKSTEAVFSSGALIYEKSYQEPGGGISHDPEVPTDTTYDSWLLPWQTPPDAQVMVRFAVPTGADPAGWPQDVTMVIKRIPW
jgi:hypothetical protein